jgi:2',3'-cyclic-nucleotide 2'-phosphodiesterase (5'-nucleotidase family)
MHLIKVLIFIFFFTILFIGCKTSFYKPYQIACQQTKIKPSQNSDTILDNYLKPYRAKLKEEMNVVLAVNPQDLLKRLPEGQLGYWMSDAMKWYADSILKQPVDVASINYGGIRIPKLPKGNVSIGLIYELMPFDNFIAIIALDSSGMQNFFSRISRSSGWPISYNTEYGHDSLNILYWHTPKNKDSFYLAVTDYVALGGDKMDLFQNYQKRYTNVKVRDALIAYAKHQKTLFTDQKQRIKLNKKNDRNE